MVGIVIRVVQRQIFFADWNVVERVGVRMAIGAIFNPRPPVVLTKPSTETEGSESDPILRTAVAARATDRVEASAARRAVGQHGEPGAGAVAGEAIAIQHDIAMDVVKIVSPGLAVAERNVGRVPETSVA